MDEGSILYWINITMMVVQKNIVVRWMGPRADEYFLCSVDSDDDDATDEDG